MAKSAFAIPVLSDAGTVQAGSQSASLPATDLLSMQPGEPWRAIDLDQAWVTLNMPSAPEVDLVAVLAHTASPAATWRIRAAATEAALTAGPTLYDSTEISMWRPSGRPADYTHLPSVLSLIDAPVSAAWWRIDIIDPGNPAGFVDIGRLYAAKLFRPERNFSFGRASGRIDPSPREISVGGQLNPEERPQRREETVTFRWLSEAELYDGWDEIQRQRGTSKDLLFIPDIDAVERLHQQLIYGLLTNPRRHINTFYRIYEMTVTVEELIP